MENTTSLELGTIFQSLGNRFLEENLLTPVQKKAFRNIAECRTLAKGGHIWLCEACDEKVPMYNSCLDRHCPKCQGPARRKWVSQRMQEVIHTHYFHVVFTLPHQLNPLVAFNPKILLTLLFRSVSQTLLLFGKDKQYLGGELGFLTILHTWDQKLQRHYHVHCIIPGGAISFDRQKWISTKRPDFLFPVHALSKTFRRLFWHGSKSRPRDQKSSSCFPLKRKITGLADLLVNKGLVLPKNLTNLDQPNELKLFENQLYRRPWIVYAKRPFGGPEQVLKYLGRYTHRVAIANYRLLGYDKGMVSFSWKDRKKENQTRTLTLSAKDFAIRFLQHVLPKGFNKIRFYGFLSGTKKKTSLALCQKLLGGINEDIENTLTDSSIKESIDSEETAFKRTCPKCQESALVRISEFSKSEVSNHRNTLWNTS